jgi:hypothetical protein
MPCLIWLLPWRNASSTQIARIERSVCKRVLPRPCLAAPLVWIGAVWDTSLGLDYSFRTHTCRHLPVNDHIILQCNKRTIFEQIAVLNNDGFVIHTDPWNSNICCSRCLLELKEATDTGILVSISHILLRNWSSRTHSHTASIPRNDYHECWVVKIVFCFQYLYQMRHAEGKRRDR